MPPLFSHLLGPGLRGRGQIQALDFPWLWVQSRPPDPGQSHSHWQAQMPALPWCHSSRRGACASSHALWPHARLGLGSTFQIQTWLGCLYKAWGQARASCWPTLGAGCRDPISWPVWQQGQDAPAWRSCSGSSAQGEEDWPDLSEKSALPSVTSCPRAPRIWVSGLASRAYRAGVWGWGAKSSLLRRLV